MLEWREATPAEIQTWDALVGRFPNHRVGHTRAWLRSLESSGLGRPRYLVARHGPEIVAALPGLETRLGPLRLFGSPLPGWQTASMGPAFDPGRFAGPELIAALLPFLEARYGVHHVELMSADLGDLAPLGFQAEAVPTYRAPLFPPDDPAQWKLLKDSARRNVRRAEKLGLRVGFETNGDFVDDHFAQLRAVYRRGGYEIPFGPRRMRACFEHLAADGRLLAISVSLPDKPVRIATGMFAVDGAELLLWSWAHHPSYRWYRATEMLAWTVMSRARELGCRTFDFMGLGEFKAKFGAELDTSKVRWVRSRYAWLRRARDLAERVYRWQQAARGRLARLRRPGPRDEDG